MSRRTLITLLSTAATAAALTGCGGSSGLNKTQLAAKMNPICGNLNNQLKSISVPGDFTTNPVHAASFLDTFIAPVQAAYGKVAALKPDGSVKSQFDAYRSELRHTIDLLKSADTAAHAKNPAGLQTLNQENSYNKTVVRPAARALGFNACA